jgi:hypothetical protein
MIRLELAVSIALLFQFLQILAANLTGFCVSAAEDRRIQGERAMQVCALRQAPRAIKAALPRHNLS